MVIQRRRNPAPAATAVALTVVACVAIICGSALLGWRWYLAAWPPLKELRAEMADLKEKVRPILTKHGFGG